MAVSDDESVLSEALSITTNPFSIAAKSTVSSNSAKHTRNAATRRPIVSSTPLLRKKLPHSQVTILRNSNEVSDPATYGTTPVNAHTADDDDEGRELSADPDVPSPTPDSEPDTSRLLQASLKRRRTQHSYIHEHIITQAHHFVCKICSKAYKRTGGTGAISRHLKDVHTIDPAASSVAMKRQREGTVVDMAILRGVEFNVQAEVKRREEMMGLGLHKATLEYLYLRWTITQDISFKQVRDTNFQSLLEYINPVANRMLPNSDCTMKTHARCLFVEGKQRLRHLLATAISDIHITCDMWTSPNHLGLLAVVGHFTSEKFELHTVTLALVEVQGEHCGFNQGMIVLGVIGDYKIRNKVGYFVMDNVGSNDQLIQTVATSLQEEGVAYNADQRRLRCNGHIINQWNFVSGVAHAKWRKEVNREL